MDLESIFGLPAHPLVVHVAVVLLPIAAVGTLVIAAVPGVRRHYAPLVLAVTVVATVAVGSAQTSGEALEDQVTETDLVEAHTGQGESVLPWAIAVTVVAAAVTAAARLDGSRRLIPPTRNRIASQPHTTQKGEWHPASGLHACRGAGELHLAVAVAWATLERPVVSSFRAWWR